MISAQKAINTVKLKKLKTLEAKRAAQRKVYAKAERALLRMSPAARTVTGGIQKYNELSAKLAEAKRHTTVLTEEIEKIKRDLGIK